MDLDYSPAAATALLLANLTALAGRAVPNSTSTSTSTSTELGVEPRLHLIPSSSVPVAYSLPNSSAVDSTTPALLYQHPPVSTINNTVDINRLIQDAIGKISSGTPATPSVPAPPSVFIINQAAAPLPTPPSDWTPEMDAVVGSVTFCLLLMFCGFGCWLLRRYRPEAWRAVKVFTMRVIRALALPISWMCGQASLILQRLHQEGSTQVSYLISFLVSWYTFSYVIGP
jgi:hypothetical protein